MLYSCQIQVVVAPILALLGLVAMVIDVDVYRCGGVVDFVATVAPLVVRMLLRGALAVTVMSPEVNKTTSLVNIIM